MIYYIADLHLGHENIIKLCERPFLSIEQMNQSLIQNWNSIVKPDDVVYIVGDFSFRAPISMKPVLKKLNGTKHLIIGNHDDSWMKNLNLAEYFESVSSLLEIKDGDTDVVLCHYPLLVWHRANRGAIHIHGHIHNREEQFVLDTLENLEAYNAGVDVNDFKPVTLEQLKNNKRVYYESKKVGKFNSF